MIVQGLLLLALCLALSACQVLPPTETTAAEQTSAPPTPTVPATPAEWIEHEVNGVALGIEKPGGWEAHTTDDGILLAERFATMASGSDAMPGIQVHIFVHSSNEFDIPEGENAAWAILEQISHKREYIGDARINTPHAFVWGRFDAAFYLSNNGDGNMSMLIGLIIPDNTWMVACNVTSPVSEAGRIRAMLPVILDSLTVDGVRLGSDALRLLPSPLDFPSDLPRPTRAAP